MLLLNVLGAYTLKLFTLLHFLFNYYTYGLSYIGHLEIWRLFLLPFLLFLSFLLCLFFLLFLSFLFNFLLDFYHDLMNDVQIVPYFGDILLSLLEIIHGLR